MHIPDDPLYHEKYYFTPGDLGFKAFDTQVWTRWDTGLLDQWYPEGARITRAARCTGVVPIQTAIGWHPQKKKQFAWLSTMRADYPAGARNRKRRFTLQL